MRSKMDLISGYKGVVGLMFGNDDSTSSDDSYVECLLDRISNGTKAEDRRTALTELQSVVAESHGAQLAFGAMGFPVMLSVLKEDRDDLQMVRGALEVLLGALTPLNYTRAPKNEVQPATVNADLLSREADSTSLLLGLLSEDEFYIRYYTLQLLTALLNNSPNRLQEVILATPGGITRLMDMILDREVIRNEALLLLTYLTREAEEIQKIVVFDNAFEKIFGIITEEGGSDGGVVVQDCLELLKNVLRKNASNQTLLRETMGFDPIISLLKLQGTSYSFSQQKTINVLSAVETINILITGSETEPANISNFLNNKTVLVQKGVIDDLLMLGVESHRAPVAVHCAALRCIGDLIAGHTGNRDAFANKVVGDDSEVEPVINAILKIILRTSSIEEFVAADYVLKKFCENFPDGQTMIACTLIPPPDSSNYDNLEEEMNMSFGSILLRGLTANENDGDLEICSRSASVLSHILVDNVSCKDRALKVELEVPVQALGGMEPLMHRMVKYLALASSLNGNAEESNGKGHLYVAQMILKLLVTWLADCPRAVKCFLDARPHLTYLMDLVSNRSATTCTKGLAAILLGECVLYNECSESSKDAFSIADAINQKIGLTTYFSKLDEMLKGSVFSSTWQSEKHVDTMSEIQDGDGNGQSNQDHPILKSLFDAAFIALVKKLDSYVREKVVFVYSHPNTNAANIPADLEQHGGESDGDYISRLKSFVQKQCSEIQDLIRRNTSLVEDLTKPSPGYDKERGKLESLVQELEERVESLKDDKEKAESDLGKYKMLAGKLESDLKSLSECYNRVNMEVETAREEGREEAEKESETELSDLLVCLGQEQSKVERLSARLAELGEDVDLLIQGVGDDAGLANDDDSEDEE